MPPTTASNPPDADHDRHATLERLETEITVLVRRAMRGLWETVDDTDALLDRHTYPLLVALTAEEPMRLVELAHRFHLDKSTASRQVRRLTDAGLAESVDDPADGRSSLLAATRHGRDRVAAVRAARARALHGALRDWDDAQCFELGALLARLNRDLGGVRPPSAAPPR